MCDLADSLNSCLDNLGQMISALKESVHNLESAVEENNGEEAKETTVLVRKIKDDINQFKV